MDEIEGVLRLPTSIICSHCYVFFPQFKVKKENADEVAFHRVSELSNDQDLVEEFIACRVWPMSHGWVVGEVNRPPMSFKKNQLVQSSAFAM